MTGNGAVATVEPAPKALELHRIHPVTMHVSIIGTAPLIVHKWSEKARKMMRDKHQGQARPKKEKQDPQAEFEAAMYRFPDGGHGMPATAFKAAIVGAARHFDGLTMVTVKQALRVIGDVVEGEQLIRLIAGEPRQREDIPRNATGVVDLRYRPEYWPWSAQLEIQFLPTVITEQGVIALVDAAGWGGVGDWRPSAPKSLSGVYGTFQVEVEG